jgi:hypothetical protein
MSCKVIYILDSEHKVQFRKLSPNTLLMLIFVLDVGVKYWDTIDM